MEEHTKTLWVENRFLSGRLVAWSTIDWNPDAKPFVEFVAGWYRHGTVEQAVVTKAVGELYLVAKALENPWSLSFWVETGWNGGRNFVRTHPQDCKRLLDEAGSELLRGYLRLYKHTVIDTARPDGEVQVLSAALKYIGEHNDPILARIHCTGREPRLLALNAFDFAFWMGIFSAHPLPTAAGGNGLKSISIECNGGTPRAIVENRRKPPLKVSPDCESELSPHASDSRTGTTRHAKRRAGMAACFKNPM